MSSVSLNVSYRATAARLINDQKELHKKISRVSLSIGSLSLLAAPIVSPWLLLPPLLLNTLGINSLIITRTPVAQTQDNISDLNSRFIHLKPHWYEIKKVKDFFASFLFSLSSAATAGSLLSIGYWTSISVVWLHPVLFGSSLALSLLVGYIGYRLLLSSSWKDPSYCQIQLIQRLREIKKDKSASLSYPEFKLKHADLISRGVIRNKDIFRCVLSRSLVDLSCEEFVKTHTMQALFILDEHALSAFLRKLLSSLDVCIDSDLPPFLDDFFHTIFPEHYNPLMATWKDLFCNPKIFNKLFCNYNYAELHRFFSNLAALPLNKKDLITDHHLRSSNPSTSPRNRKSSILEPQARFADTSYDFALFELGLQLQKVARGNDSISLERMQRFLSRYFGSITLLPSGEFIFFNEKYRGRSRGRSVDPSSMHNLPTTDPSGISFYDKTIYPVSHFQNAEEAYPYFLKLIQLHYSKDIGSDPAFEKLVRFYRTQELEITSFSEVVTLAKVCSSMKTLSPTSLIEHISKFIQRMPINSSISLQDCQTLSNLDNIQMDSSVWLKLVEVMVTSLVLSQSSEDAIYQVYATLSSKLPAISIKRSWNLSPPLISLIIGISPSVKSFQIEGFEGSILALLGSFHPEVKLKFLKIIDSRCEKSEIPSPPFKKHLLTHLSDLDLTGSNLPLEDFSLISRAMINLDSLNLSRAPIAEKDLLDYLLPFLEWNSDVKLNSINVSNTNISNELLDIILNSQLYTQSLNISNCPFITKINWDSLDDIESLTMDNTPAEIVTSDDSMRNASLKSLSLANWPATYSWDFLTLALDSLTTLKIEGTDCNNFDFNIDQDAPLRNLSLINCRSINLASIVHLKQLESLNLTGTNCSEESMKYLISNLPQLKTFINTEGIVYSEKHCQQIRNTIESGFEHFFK